LKDKHDKNKPKAISEQTECIFP